MKFWLTLAFVLTFGSGAVLAQQQSGVLDGRSTKASLLKEVERTKPAVLTKGIQNNAEVGRVYTKDAVVVTRASGVEEKHPYVVIPLLFQVNSDELLDGSSRANVTRLADILKDLSVKNITFAIEGHASAEGDSQRNLELSKLRAAKIQSLLREQGVPSAVLVRQEGFGSTYAQSPAIAPDSKLQQDRRVLVVREK